MQLRTVRCCAFVACLLFQAGCENPTPISVKITPGPSFEISGSGELADFAVFAPSSGLKIANPFEEKDLVWRIMSSNPRRGTRSFKFEYGTVPNSYGQSVPSSSKPVSPLVPGVIYAFWAKSTNVGEASGHFALGKQGVIRVAIPDLCFTSANGQLVETKCGTHEPYPQPTDVEEFARQHQLAQ